MLLCSQQEARQVTLPLQHSTQAIVSGVTDIAYAVSTAGVGAKNIEDLAIISRSGSNETLYAKFRCN